jgi:hypothetical protein
MDADKIFLTVNGKKMSLAKLIAAKETYGEFACLTR